MLLATFIHMSALAEPSVHSVEDAKALLNAGHYSEALPILQKSAVSGSPEAELYLGLMYQSGWGVAQDYTQALQWYEKSAAAKNSEAANELGSFFRTVGAWSGTMRKPASGIENPRLREMPNL